VLLKPAQLIETNPLDEYQFVGSDGERITCHAAPLLGTLGRLVGPETVQFFAIPKFNDNRTMVTWFSQCKGLLEPFWELPDQRQHAVLEQLAQIAPHIATATRKLDQLPASESATYARLLPLLLNFPEPVEYHLYLVDGNPVATHWGMNKQLSGEARDILSPFIDQWRVRLRERAHQAAEAGRNAAREQSFLGRLTRAGARSGAITASLLWDDTNDLDLHIECPGGAVLNFENKQACGGILDIDRNANPNALTSEPVENIVWTRKPDRAGQYSVYVHFYKQHDASMPCSKFELRLKRGASVRHFKGQVTPGERLKVTDFKI
jgi:hypothetical protein